jgi:hypothetical protein
MFDADALGFEIRRHDARVSIFAAGNDRCFRGAASFDAGFTK